MLRWLGTARKTANMGETAATEAASKPDDGVEREAELLAQADRYLLGNYRPARFIMRAGQGCELIDTRGRRYLDFCAGVAVCCLGHSHPALTAALHEQAARVMHVSNYFFNEQNVALAAELCVATGYQRAFFCNSGAEANEVLFKVARRYHYEAGAPHRQRILAFERAFHGRTMGALALTGNPAYQKGFGPPLEGVAHLPFGDLDALTAAMSEEVAAVVVEPVQGEGGVHPAPDGFLAGARALCDEFGALLLMDEVQTGMGRTGRLLAAEHDGVRADAVALAKGLGGGFPIGAVLFDEKLAGALPPGAHGSTFGGNPLASVAARVVLRYLLHEGLLAATRERGQQLSVGLQRLAERHPTVCLRERGVGLLRVLVLADGLVARELLPVARAHRLLLTAAGPSGLRFTPPLVVSAAEIDEALVRTDAVLTEVANGR